MSDMDYASQTELQTFSDENEAWKVDSGLVRDLGTGQFLNIPRLSQVQSVWVGSALLL